MPPRDAQHYYAMMERNPHATVGATLAARALASIEDGPDATPRRATLLALQADCPHGIESADLADRMRRLELRMIRVRLGLTQKAFALRLHRRRNSVGRYERGERAVDPAVLDLARRLEAEALTRAKPPPPD